MASRKKPPKAVWALFDECGNLVAASYRTRQDAKDDAWGPWFRGGHTIRKYMLVPKSAEKEGKGHV